MALCHVFAVVALVASVGVRWDCQCDGSIGHFRSSLVLVTPARQDWAVAALGGRGGRAGWMFLMRLAEMQDPWCLHASSCIWCMQVMLGVQYCCSAGTVGVR